jgi:hypothetical protein
MHVDPAGFNVSYEPQRPGTHAFGAKVDVIPREGEIVDLLCRSVSRKLPASSTNTRAAGSKSFCAIQS